MAALLHYMAIWFVLATSPDTPRQPATWLLTER
jgi:hypothetical protein